MKKNVVFLFLLLSVSVYSQNKLKLKVANTTPRVGETIQLFIDFSFFNNVIDSQLNIISDDMKVLHVNHRGQLNYTRSFVFDSVGTKQIGPFEFTFNGRAYITDSVKIEVLGKLPSQSGVWVRQMESDGNKYILVEKFLVDYDNQKKSTRKKMEDLALDQKKFSGTKFGKVGTSSITANNTYYSVDKYLVRRSSLTGTEFEINKTHFEIFPNNVPLVSELLSL